MYRSLSKSYLFKILLVFLFLCIVFLLLFVWDHNKKLNDRELGDVLYNVLLGHYLTEDEQMENLQAVVQSKTEPYASFASMYLADIYYAKNNVEGVLEGYKRIINTPEVEKFTKALAEVKISLHNSSEFFENAKDIYYFTSQMLEVLNGLEAFSTMEDVDVIKGRVLNLRDSIAAPRDVKSIAGELAKLYFFDYPIGSSDK